MNGIGSDLGFHVLSNCYVVTLECVARKMDSLVTLTALHMAKTGINWNSTYIDASEIWPDIHSLTILSWPIQACARYECLALYVLDLIETV